MSLSDIEMRSESACGTAPCRRWHQTRSPVRTPPRPGRRSQWQSGSGRHQKALARLAANTAGTISAKILALRDSKSNRLSPGLSLVPAASTTTRAPSRPAESPCGPDRIRRRRSVQESRACAITRSVLRSTSVIRTDTAHHHGVSRRGADLSGPDNANLHAVPPISRMDIPAAAASQHTAAQSSALWRVRMSPSGRST